MRRRSKPVLAALFLVGLVAGAVAEEPTVEAVEGPPDVLSEAVRSTLDPVGHRVSMGAGPLLDFWLRNELPLGGASEGVFGIELGAVTESGLVGAVRVHEEWIDYRETVVQPAVYTMRYYIQPADGDHMGVSEYRDFLLLLPVDDDADPETLYEKEPLMELSQKASERVHPAVIAVFPIWDEVEGPTMLANEIDQWTLAVPVGDWVLGLVVEGSGDLP